MYLRFYLCALLGFLVPALGWLGLVAVQVGAPTPPARWNQLRVEWKAARAARDPVPKLLIVSGSNSLYGLSASELSRRTSVPTYNMAVSAGFGIDLILHQALPVVRGGDLVLLPMEYGLYVDTGAPNTLQTDYVFGCEPGYMATMSPWRLLNMAFGMPLARLRYGFSYYKHAMSGSPDTMSWDLSLDEHGDQLHHRLADQQEPQRRAVALAARTPWLQAYDDLTPFAREQLTAFVADCRARGARVVATYPVIMASAAPPAPGKDLSQSLRLLPAIAAFYRSLDVPLLGEPDAFFLPREQFFDSQHHLTAENKLIHTAMVLPLLAPHLAPMRAAVATKAL